MKRNLLYTIWAVAVAMSAASCSQEDFFTDKTGNILPLAITVTDGGFASDEPTRAAEAGYATKFTAGDACGLYIVRGGAVIHENVKLTAAEAEDGSLTWQPAETLGGGIDGETYFLYYPYQEDMTGKTDMSATDDDAAFFAPLISGWQPEADQSDYATGYTASDLMTATGTAGRTGSTVRLSFEMTHRMALAVVELPKTTVYDFTNEGIADYIVPTAADFADSPAKPYRMADDIYRLIVNPAATAPKITGSYADGTREFAFTPSADAGSYKTYKIDGATPIIIPYTLQAGDYFCTTAESDSWHIVPKDCALTEADNCIGVVFCTDPSRIGAAATEVLQEKGTASPRGLVMAITEASDDSLWGVYQRDENSGGTDGEPFKENTNRLDKIYRNVDGYGETHWIIDTYKEEGTVLQDSYSAFYHAGRYGTADSGTEKYAAPTNTTGWFVPGTGQWWDILSNLGGIDLNSYQTGTESVLYVDDAAFIVDNLNKHLGKIAGAKLFVKGETYFWSSSEYRGADAYRIGFDDGQFYPLPESDNLTLEIVWARKNYYRSKVRCCLAF